MPVRRLLLAADPARSAPSALANELTRGLERLPELRVELSFAPPRLARALIDAPLAATSSGRDFLLVSHLGVLGANPGDVVAAGEQRSEDWRVSVCSLNARGRSRLLLAPPAVSIGGLRRPWSEAASDLLAASIAALGIAASSEPDAAADGDPNSPLLARLERRYPPPTDAAALGPGGGDPIEQASSELALWLLIWQGLRYGDVERLERAWSLVAPRAEPPHAVDGDRLADIGLIALALGGEPGARPRLREGLIAARAAAGAVPARDPALLATRLGLLGRLAAALGRLEDGRSRLIEAEAALARVLRLAGGPWLEGACGLEGIAEELADVRRRLAMRPTGGAAGGSPGNLPPAGAGRPRIGSRPPAATHRSHRHLAGAPRGRRLQPILPP